MAINIEAVNDVKLDIVSLVVFNRNFIKLHGDNDLDSHLGDINEVYKDLLDFLEREYFE